jgi:hypothetical protein
VKLGLYLAQDEFFRSLFIYWKPGIPGLKIPIFPGGYLVGGLLVINLFAAHLRYYRSGAQTAGHRDDPSGRGAVAAGAVRHGHVFGGEPHEDPRG